MKKQDKVLYPFHSGYLAWGGSLLLFLYAVYKKDPVFILGQAPNLFIYSRNIWLIKKNKKKRE